MPDYLSRLPASLPPDTVLTHDSRGWWLQPPADGLTVCECGRCWHLGEHFKRSRPRRYARGEPTLPMLPSLMAS
jgi:hypothetical protein